MPPVGKSGAFDELHQVADLGLRVVDHVDDGVDDLAQVVRRHVGGHSDRDAGGAVDQQVGQLAGRVDGSFRVPSKLSTKSTVSLSMSPNISMAMLLQPAFGVTHGRGLVAVDGAEVALAIDQRVAQ